MQRHAFRAMGTEIELLLDAPSTLESRLALASVEREFRLLEAILSRFSRDSELSRLNTEGIIEAGEELLTVVRLALDARERTRGRFDPTVYGALVAAGYDRSFEDLAGVTTQPASRRPAGGRVRVVGRRIELEPGVQIDLGGIGKGFAVDRSVELLAAAGPCLVNAGGDLAVSGLPEEGAWPVGVETPDGPITLGLKAGALATSGSDRRRWLAGGATQHHLIDPRTARPSTSDLLRVTVTGPTAVEAEVLAKALYLVGEVAAVAEAGALGVPGLLVTIDGRVRTTGGLA